MAGKVELSQGAGEDLVDLGGLAVDRRKVVGVLDLFHLLEEVCEICPSSIVILIGYGGSWALKSNQLMMLTQAIWLKIRRPDEQLKAAFLLGSFAPVQGGQTEEAIAPVLHDLLLGCVCQKLVHSACLLPGLHDDSDRLVLDAQALGDFSVGEAVLRM